MESAKSAPRKGVGNYRRLVGQIFSSTHLEYTKVVPT